MIPDTHALPLEQAPGGYDMFKNKEDNREKVVQMPSGQMPDGICPDARRNGSAAASAGTYPEGGLRCGPGHRESAQAEEPVAAVDPACSQVGASGLSPCRAFISSCSASRGSEDLSTVPP